MVISGQPSNQAANLIQAHSGQQLHVSGMFIVLLELALVLENLLPILVVVTWLPAPAREVSDRLVTAFSVTCILSALVPTPLGLASYFSGGWYGGTPTCTVYQLTSIWCNLFSLSLLTYICVNCHVAVWHLMKVKSVAHCQSCQRSACTSSSQQINGGSLHALNNSMPPRLPSPHRSASAQSIPSSTSLAPHCDASAIVTFVSPCNDIRGHTNKSYDVTVCDSTENLRIDITNGNAYCEHISYPQQVNELSIPISSIKSDDVPQSHSKTDKKFVTYVPQNMSQHDSERPGNFSHDIRNQYSELNPNPSQTSPTNKCHNTANTDANFTSARNQSDFQLRDDSQDMKCYAPANNENIEECTGTRIDVKCSQVRSSVIFERLEGDLKYSESGSNIDNTRKESTPRRGGCLCLPQYQPRNFVSVMVLLLSACTLAISSLPVIGFGPRTTHTETSCRSWLVPLPLSIRERTFCVVYLFFVYACLFLGCSSGINVFLKVSRRMKQERKRRSRLYHEEDNVPDVVELFTLNDMKRHYSLTCVVMAGLLTWLPIVTMLTLQKAGVQVSEATIMYSSIATSLPGLLNPLLYSLALARYRTGYKAIMEKCCCKSKAQRSQHLRGDQSTTNTTDVDIKADTMLNSTSDSHICLHGRVNPNFSSHLDLSIDDTCDEDDDEDYFPDDSEQMDDDRIQQTSRINEKTPLQAMTTSSPSHGALKTLLTNRAKTQWQHQQDSLSSSCSDSERLLVSRSYFADEETGL